MSAELGELDGDGEVGGFGVADAVADVVGESADGEGELVGVAGVAEEVHDEVAGTDVVGEVGEELVAEGVVADVLDDAAAVGVGAGVLDLGGGEVRVAALEQRDDGAVPGEIDELLVGEEGVGVGGPDDAETNRGRWRGRIVDVARFIKVECPLGVGWEKWVW